jgi:hypothetical protein
VGRETSSTSRLYSSLCTRTGRLSLYSFWFKSWCAWQVNGNYKQKCMKQETSQFGIYEPAVTEPAAVGVSPETFLLLLNSRKRHLLRAKLNAKKVVHTYACRPLPVSFTTLCGSSLFIVHVPLLPIQLPSQLKVQVLAALEHTHFATALPDCKFSGGHRGGHSVHGCYGACVSSRRRCNSMVTPGWNDFVCMHNLRRLVRPRR